MKITKITDSFLDIVYPENMYCICCGDMIPQSRVHCLCDDCVSSLSWLSENPFESRLDEFSFDGVISLMSYDHYAQRMIHDLKFHGKNYYARAMGRLMGELLLDSGLCTDPVFIPVPMHAVKKRQRGYNQAELLAFYASGVFGAKMVKDALIKDRLTASMRTARASGRGSAIVDSIILNPQRAVEIRGRELILVDDVITTGITAENCARALKFAGPKSINILTFAAVKYKGNH